MSVRVMSLVWDNGPEKSADRLMMLAIADHTDDLGVAWPGMERLAAKCCVGVDAARATVRRLEAAGWLSITTGGGTRNGHGQPNRYQLAMDRLNLPPRAEGGTPIPTPPSTPSYPPVDAAPTPPSTGGEPSLEPPVEPPMADDALFDTAPAKASTSRARRLPDDFRPTPDHLTLASSLGVDLRVEGPQFVDHHTARGSTMKDWDAALRTWIRNAAKFRGGSNVTALPVAASNAWGASAGPVLPPRPAPMMYGG